MPVKSGSYGNQRVPEAHALGASYSLDGTFEIKR